MGDNNNNTIETLRKLSYCHKINVAYFATGLAKDAVRLQGIISAIVPGDEREIFCTIEDLSSRLRQPGERPTIAVLLAASSKDLADILSIHDLLRDIRIILILPDREEDTVAWGHSLQPRFLSYIDNDFTDVAAVLDKMMRRGIL